MSCWGRNSTRKTQTTRKNLGRENPDNNTSTMSSFLMIITDTFTQASRGEDDWNVFFQKIFFQVSNCIVNNTIISDFQFLRYFLFVGHFLLPNDDFNW